MLSPHPDDAALSCGAAIARATRAGAAVTVLTCFDAAAPPYGPLAQTLHRLWGQPDDPAAQRRREDQASARALGAEPAFAGLLDAIYRGYDDPDALFGPVAQADAPLARQVADAAAARLRPASVVLCPLGIGGHVDHVLTHQAGRRLAQRGAVVRWYEEQPHALEAGAASGTAPSGAWELSRKVAAVLAHRSQLPMLFATADPQRIAQALGTWPERIHRNTVR